MKRMLFAAMLVCAACSDTVGTATSTGGTGDTGPSTSAGTTGLSISSGGSAAGSGNGNGASGSVGASGSSGGDCVQTSAYAGDASLCCSGVVDGNGYCAEASGNGSGSTTSFTSTNGSGNSTGTTGQVGTGTTTGGTCPNNMPDLVTGQGGRGVGACSPSAGCPKGYQCTDGQCLLNSSSTLQVTLSFDHIEDFDLHLLEPLNDGGYCEIYYGNAGTDPDAGGSICSLFPQFCRDGGLPLPGVGQGCPSGWLDRDSNAACGNSGSESGGSPPDGVNVENILFPSWEAPPSGTYFVRVDYWENCDSTVCSDGMDSSACGAGHPSSHLGVQVRTPDSAIWQYCPDISLSGQGANDHGQNGHSFSDNGGAGSGFYVTTFTVP